MQRHSPSGAWFSLTQITSRLPHSLAQKSARSSLKKAIISLAHSFPPSHDPLIFSLLSHVQPVFCAWFLLSWLLSHYKMSAIDLLGLSLGLWERFSSALQGNRNLITIPLLHQVTDILKKELLITSTTSVLLLRENKKDEKKNQTCSMMKTWRRRVSNDSLQIFILPHSILQTNITNAYTILNIS